MTKRLIALLLSVMMVVTLLPMGIFAEDVTDVPEDPEVATYDYEHITVRTEGVNQAPQQMTAETPLQVVGGDNPIDVGAGENNVMPTDGIIGASTHGDFNSKRAANAIWMRSTKTWLYGYAVKIEGLSSSAVATVNAKVWNHSGVSTGTAEGYGWDVKNTKINVPGNGTYFLLINGAVNSTRLNRTAIAYVNEYKISMSADATVTFLGEAEAAIADLGNSAYVDKEGEPPKDVSGYKNSLSVQYVDGGETKSVDYPITDGFAPTLTTTYNAIGVDDKYILGMLPKFPEKVSEDGKYISRHIGWSKTEGSAKAEAITVLDRHGLINTPLYPVWFTTPKVEAPATQVGTFNAGEVVTLPKGEAGTLPATTVWKGNASFCKNDTDPGYDGLTMVFKVDGAQTPVFTGRVNPTTLNKKGAFSRTEGEGDKSAYESPWGAESLDYPKADGTQGKVPAMYLGTLGNGYFYLYWNAKALYMQESADNVVRGMTKIDLFDGSLANETTDFGSGYNNNDNATFQMLAVVAGNLDVNVNFVVGDEVHTYNKKYTDFSGFGAGEDANCATRGSLVSADDAYASLGVALPESPAVPGKTYRFYWADEKGNPVDAIYKSQNLYPVWEELRTKVVFLGSDSTTLEEKVVDRSATPEYTGEEPTKAETDDATYVFKGWSRDGVTVVDLANEKLDAEEVVYTPVFVSNPKLKASLEPVEALSFNKAGKYKIKLNYTDITLDVLAGTTTPITGGTVTVSSDVFANANGEKTFDVTFDSIDENGVTNAEITLTSEFVAGTFGVNLRGTVTGEEATATLYDLTENIAVTGQQIGKYYGDSAEIVPLNKNNGDTPPEAQTIWQDNVQFGDKYAGATFVLKATGIEDPVILSNINPTMWTTANEKDMFKYRWFYFAVDENAPLWGGAKEPSRYMKIDKDGYYLFYINSRLFDMSKFLGAKTFSIFFDDGVNKMSRESDETTVKCNTNENAALQMVAVVAGDLQPTVTFHDAEGGVITSVKHDYTTVGMTEPSNGNLTRQTMQLVSAEDIYSAVEGAEIPVKTPEAGKEYLRYDFKGWAYKDGAPADGIYMNADLYPIYDVVDTRPDCTIKFMNGDEQYGETQIVKETELPVFPEINPTKPSTDEHSYIFQGWDVNGDGVVDEPAPATVDGATYTAVYKEVERRWEVKFYKEDKTTYLGSIYVRGEIKDGTTPTAPEKPADVQYTYTFDKWVDAEGNELVESEVTKDIEVYASYKSTLNKYTVTFLDDDDTLITKVTVDYGTAATITDPTKEKDEYYTYTFSGWDADVSNVVGDMTVKAVYSKVFTKFDDVAPDAWYAKQVEYVTVNNYFSGISKTTFAPTTIATRAMVLRVLYSAAGKPSVEGMTHPFEDVPEGEWYTPAVTWGYNVKVAHGKGEKKFDPNATVSREEFCSFIYRFAEKVLLKDGKHVDMRIPISDTTSSLSTFKDKNDIDSWAQASIRWCKYAEIVRGTDIGDDTYFYPRKGLSRAELATMIKGLFESEKLVPVKEK